MESKREPSLGNQKSKLNIHKRSLLSMGISSFVNIVDVVSGVGG